MTTTMSAPAATPLRELWARPAHLVTTARGGEDGGLPVQSVSHAAVSAAGLGDAASGGGAAPLSHLARRGRGRSLLAVQRRPAPRCCGLPGRRAVRRRSSAGPPPRRGAGALGLRRVAVLVARDAGLPPGPGRHRGHRLGLRGVAGAAGHRPGAERPARHLRGRRLRPDGRDQPPHPRPRQLRLRLCAVCLDVDAGAGYRQRLPQCQWTTGAVGGRPTDPPGICPLRHRAAGAR